MYLENPNVLWLIPLSVLFLVGLGAWGWRVKKEIGELFHVDLHRMKGRLIRKHIAAGLLIALLAFALASPKIPFPVPPVQSKTGEMALLVDVSTSMAARKDTKSPSSLERVKPILNEIVDHMQELGGVRIGLYGFTNMARSHVPMVGKQDYPYLKASIDKVLDVNSTPGSGSSFGRPILNVSGKFSKNAKIKLIVLFSDGEVSEGVSRGMQGTERGLIEQAMIRTGLEGIKVITVGVGERKGAKVPIFNAEGDFTSSYAQLHDANLYFYLREEILQEIASRTGGRYYAENDRRALIGFIKESFDLAPLVEITGQPTEYRSIAPLLILVCLPIWAVVARRFLMR